ncbi:MAG: LptF/LptG family permease [Nitrospirota bacterium]|nr:LptF/LptG family permease [Nitrospirota bacterium]
MIIHRTIFGELFKNFAVTVFSMSVLLFMENFVRMTRFFMGKGTDFTSIVKLFFYLQPSIFMLSVPMAILIATSLTFGRMAADSELVVLKGCGMSFWSISRAAVILSILCFVVVLFNSIYLLPRGTYSFRQTLQETIVKKASMTFEESTFSDMFKGTVIFVKEKVSDKEFKGVFVYKDEDGSLKSPFVIVAQRGVISSDPEEGLMKLSMKDGLIHTVKGGSSSEITFSGYDLVLTSGVESVTASKPEEIRTSVLWKAGRDNIPFAIELNRRFALPFACLIFGVLGPALSYKVGKIGRMGGFSISLAILIFYYMMLILGKGLADAGKISPLWGGWLPNIFFSAVTLLFFNIAYKDKPSKRIKI